MTGRWRRSLPQLGGGPFLTDGGIETSLIFHSGAELPLFAAFHLLASADGEAMLLDYFRPYAALAQRFRSGLVLESPTWRASADWGARLGYAPEALAEANRLGIALLERLRDGVVDAAAPIVLSGCIGPRGDGYVPDAAMGEEEAETYHREQIDVFAGTAADMVCAITMTTAAEATGIARAARGAGLPAAISFTLETDGRLPTGQPLREAIEQVDAATGAYPAYYMINCAHPSHFEGVLDEGGGWRERIRGLRANASRRSHAELNEAPDLDEGDPDELGRDYARLVRRLPGLNVLGGCCGTDHRHVERIAGACVPLLARASD